MACLALGNSIRVRSDRCHQMVAPEAALAYHGLAIATSGLAGSQKMPIDRREFLRAAVTGTTGMLPPVWSKDGQTIF